MKSRFLAHYTRLADNRALRFMPRIVFGFLFVQWLTTLPYAALAWGTDNVLFRYGMPSSAIDNAVRRLYYQPELFYWIYHSHAALLLLSTLNRPWVIAARALSWITGLMLYHAAPDLFGWGMLLLLQTTFFLLPVQYGSSSPLRIWLNSLSLLALRMQTLIVLFSIALFMWGSQQWRTGSALYYLVHQVFHLRSAFFAFFSEKTTLLQLLSYAWLIICSVLPVGFLWRRTRVFASTILLVVGGTAVIVATNLAVGLGLIALALPWIDATSEDTSTTIPR